MDSTAVKLTDRVLLVTDKVGEKKIEKDQNEAKTNIVIRLLFHLMTERSHTNTEEKRNSGNPYETKGEM